MNPVKALFAIVILVGVLALIAAGCFWAIRWFVGLFATDGAVFGLDANLLAVLVFSVFVVGMFVRWGQTARDAAQARTLRADVYGRVVAAWAQAAGGSGGNGAVPEGIRGLEAVLALHASSRVLEGYRALRSASPEEHRTELRALVLEMRRDLGRSLLDVDAALAELV